MKKLLIVLVIIITSVNFTSCNKDEVFNESNIVGEWKCIQNEGWEKRYNSNEKDTWNDKIGDKDWDDSDISFYDDNTGAWDGDAFKWVFNNNKFIITFFDTDYNENDISVSYLSKDLLIIEIKYKDSFHNKYSFIKD